ncbi:cell division protein FtsI [Prauserella marina]|uniref:Cell division protein FtsI (Penicillin-binding protein 3) n=1 Tax=Prauserella marina TaxID=530584 RepID=A0A222VN94_9PSEU|nr:penicillin-binding protein 2 [Prauserella marina]ASR35379.1 cell division protein FtsI [Prauserella marina]PWV84821.1 cell division protein FtsI (penicillin-binding protein 3) [Prauserella marina]SDC12274.1 cell division protein FtsI (penicillin-binding protein 3) [Prauserella marina]
MPRQGGSRKRAEVTGGTARRTYSVTARGGGAPSATRNIKGRFAVGRIFLVVLLVAAGLKLVQIQGFEAEALSAKAEQQRTTTIDIPAQRGSIVDRNGAELAFSVETRMLWANLRLMRKTWDDFAKQNPESGENYTTRVAEIAAFIAEKLPGKTTEKEMLERFHRDASFTYLVDGVEPSIADEIKNEFPEIGYEKRAKREYPGSELAANIVGFANWRTEDPDVSKHNIHGLIGLENLRDNDLAGTPGQQIVDTAQGNDNVVIPGTERDLQAAIPGSDLQLTIDSDLQYDLQSKLSDYVAKSRAQGGSAVVLDAKTGEVYALANDKTFDPNDSTTFEPELTNNTAVTTPYEPGSVNKIIAATAAIDSGIAEPDSVRQVPGSIKIADHTVRDAWEHGTQPFTTTGIFAKSSNVGTLMLSEEVGPDKYMDLLRKFGLGQRTGIGLPGESSGYVPPRSQWSGTTFGNLPIGQGLSMTVVQMASMYQAIANGGVRVEPRVVDAKITPDGDRVPEPAPKSTRVVSEQTANTVKDMLRAVTQHEGGNQNGTAPAAALEGYQISGKTGTGQQVDPQTGAYSNNLYNITFAGILPADNPRFVVGIRLDAPDTTIEEGSSAAPLFHDIASYLAQRYELPLSDQPSPVVTLVQ